MCLQDDMKKLTGRVANLENGYNESMRIAELENELIELKTYLFGSQRNKTGLEAFDVVTIINKGDEMNGSRIKR